MGVKRFLAAMLVVLAVMWSVCILKSMDEAEYRHLSSSLNVEILKRINSSTSIDEMIYELGKPTTHLVGTRRLTNQQCEFCWWENDRQQVIKMSFLDAKLVHAEAMGFGGGTIEKRTDAVQGARP